MPVKCWLVQYSRASSQCVPCCPLSRTAAPSGRLKLLIFSISLLSAVACVDIISRFHGKGEHAALSSLSPPTLLSSQASFVLRGRPVVGN